MAAPTPEAIETARKKVQQAKARLQALEARAATLNRKQDARRKIILGGLLLDAAMKDPAWESRLNGGSGGGGMPLHSLPARPTESLWHLSQRPSFRPSSKLSVRRHDHAVRHLRS
jgi:hypothetical protein